VRASWPLSRSQRQLRAAVGLGWSPGPAAFVANMLCQWHIELWGAVCHCLGAELDAVAATGV
jgi:hypothetical protein